MGLKYSDQVYANDRLNGSVVRHEDRPVWCEFVEDGNARVKYMGTDRWSNVPYMELDLTPVPLGNVNINGFVVYVSRMPKRRDWRQGLRLANMRFDGVIGNARINIVSNELANTILGAYPDITDCFDRIGNGECNGSAFSHHFSVGEKRKKGFQLYYKTFTIGVADITDGGQIKTQLNDEFKFLEEFLKEEMKIG